MHFPPCYFLGSPKLLVISPMQRQKTHLWRNQDIDVCVCVCVKSDLRPLHPWLAALCRSFRNPPPAPCPHPPDSTKGIYVSCRVCCGLRLEHNWLNMNAYFSSLESRSSPTSISFLQFCICFPWWNWKGNICKKMVQVSENKLPVHLRLNYSTRTFGDQHVNILEYYYISFQKLWKCFWPNCSLYKIIA